MSSTESIYLKGLEYEHSKGWRLSIPDLIFAERKTHVLIGLSGSGKTTLLKILMGLLKLKQGQLNFGATDQANFGYVVQEGGLFPHLSVRDNILIPKRSVDPRYAKSFSARYSGNEITQDFKDRILFLLDLVHLEASVLDRNPFELSGGQKQRVGIVRALLLDPPLLYLDEPMGALDPITRFDLQSDLKEIFTRLKKTVFMITHDMNEALYFGDSITVLDQGKILQSGPKEEIIKNPRTDFVKKLIQSKGGHSYE